MNDEIQVRKGLSNAPAPEVVDTTAVAQAARDAGLDQQQLTAIARTVPGGLHNVQDIYPLAPIQQGMLFHRVLNERSDTYLLSTLFELRSRTQLDPLVRALQKVVDRHDALRTAIVWEALSKPVQVVYRRALIEVDEIAVAVEHVSFDELKEQMRPERYVIDLRRAPLLRLRVVAGTRDTVCYALLLVHHVICDHQSLQALISETMNLLRDDECPLPEPVPYRSYVTAALVDESADAAEAYFRRKLGDVDEPVAPFDVLDVHGDGSRIEAASQPMAADLAARIRAQARQQGVSVARFFHAAWALVVAATSGRDDIVYGTVVLTARQRSAAARPMLGMSVNTLPLRLRLRDLTARQLLATTDHELTELLRYEQTSLPAAQRCSAVPAGTPLFTTLLNYRRNDSPSVHSGGNEAGVCVRARGEAWSNYPLAMIVDDFATGFVLTAQTDRRINAHRVIGYLQSAAASLVAALEDAEDTCALRLPILPASEWRQVTQLFNATHTDYPADRLIHELFEEQVRKRPDAVAAVFEGAVLTYAQLNERANQLARHLRNHNVGVQHYVVVLMQRSLHSLVAQVAVLKCGAVYVPMDPDLPVERQAFMLSDCGARTVLSVAAAAPNLASPDVQWIDCSQAMHDIARESCENLGIELSSGATAYVMYTSGSTGVPKGVLVPHRAVNRLVINNGYAAIGPDDCLAHYSNPTFDASTLEIWGALLHGARVVIVRQRAVLDPLHFRDLLLRERATLLYMSVGLFNQYADPLADVFPRLRYLMVGGDALEPGTIRRTLHNNPPQHLLNVYGPTECTTYATTYLIETVPDDACSLPIGRPISNTQIYILDGNREPVPIGVTGELYIGGAGVARGYLNRPQLTAERFVLNPFVADPDARMYKTGDLGRWRADGVIEHLGRNDYQIKLRGFRIELGEIETHLRQHEAVKEAVVLARTDGPGEKRLAAYVTLNRDATTSPATCREALRAHLRNKLPEYMVPSALVILDELPLTSNGKIDRRALPAPELQAYASRAEEEPPQGEAEEILAGAWQALLGVERVGRNDNFFELGGHSLLIVQLTERLRRMGLRLEPRRIFATPTLKELAQQLHGAAALENAIPPNLIPAQCAHISPDLLPLVTLEQQHIERVVRMVPGGVANVQDIYPLAPLQEGILFHHSVNAQAGDPYVVPFVLCVESKERLAQLVTALQRVIDRHDVLRTAFHWQELPQPVQVVYREAVLQPEHVRFDAARSVAEQTDEWLSPALQKMDVRQAPLVRLQVAPDPHSERWYALLQMHHLVADNTAQEIVLSEVAAYLQRPAPDLPEPVSYRNHVAQALAHSRLRDAQAFFRRKLADLDEPTIPFGLADVHGDGGQLEEAGEETEVALAESIRSHARRLAVSVATLFHTAWSLVIANTSGRDDVVFGSVLLGRLQGSAGAQRILGMFINTLPLRLRLNGVSAREAVDLTQRELAELLNHEQASLAMAQRCSAVSGGRSLFSALLNYRHKAASAEWFNAAGVQTLAVRHRSNYPITMSIDDLGERFALRAQTDRRVDPRRMTGYLRVALESLTEALAHAPDTPALSLSILPRQELHELLDSFNGLAVPYPERHTIHELFEEQVRRTPDAPAVAYGQESLTYVQLNSKANQLARYLRSKGVDSDSLVGLCIERSVEMIVGLLGILKAGGAYVPLDPSYPAARLAYILNDAAPRVILTQTAVRALLPDTAAEVLALDGDWQQVAANPSGDIERPAHAARGSDLAYVIYTSGSTGQPKGVMIEHCNVLNLWLGLRPLYDRPSGCARVALNASISFDASVQQIVQLLSGRTLVVVPQAVRRDPTSMLRFLAEERIAASDCTPAQLKAWLAAGLSSVDHPVLELVLVGGEAIDSDLWNTLARSTVDFVNVYGPTECTVDATAAHLHGDSTAPHIGRPLPNRRVYVLSSQGQPVPVGVAGEIYIGGAGVGRGYLNAPQLTSDRFVADPRGSPRGRMYRTGDLARWRADGNLEYLGRNDDQVKIRGYRIELSEIEAQLARHDRIRAVTVIAREDIVGDKRLVAYLVPRYTGDAPSAEELRAYLKKWLPEYMVPSAFVVLEGFPTTPTGKLDRRALPAPESHAYASRPHELPQGQVEETIAGIWCELLGVAEVGRSDNFFELGGHSLLAMQLIARIQALLSTDIAIRTVFESPTLQELAQRTSERRVADVLDEIAQEGTDMRELLGQVVSIPEHAVKQLLGELTVSGR
jgi:amino acid adenylation domain-containing protein